MTEYSRAIAEDGSVTELERVEKGWRREVEGWEKGEKRDEQEVLVNKSRKKKGEKRREEVKDNEIKYSTGEGETFYCLT